MSTLNSPGASNLSARISDGDVDKTSDWSFSAEDGNKLLGADGDNWAAYSKWHLGEDASETAKTKARYKYPFGKNGKVYRSALTAIRQRAGQQGDAAIYEEAGKALDKIDGKEAPLQRQVKTFDHGLIQVKFSPDSADAAVGTFSGYGAIFGNEDAYGDVIEKGAFKRTLKEAKARGSMPKMLLQHGSWMGPAEDGIPIGKWTSMEEDDKGLACTGELFALDTQKGKYIYAGLKSGALDGLSIGYIPVGVKYGQKAEEPDRTLTDVELLEVSVVTFPANNQALVDSVKNVDRLETLSDFEKCLRDVGFSRHQATTFVSRLKKSLLQSDSERQATALREANLAAGELLSKITQR